MGIKRQAQDGRFYERRRTRGGRYYTVVRGSDSDEARRAVVVLCILFGVLLIPFTYGLSLVLPIAFALGSMGSKAKTKQRDEARQFEKLLRVESLSLPQPVPPTVLDELATRKVWRVMVWGAVCGTHFRSREDAESAAAHYIAMGWNAKNVEVFEVDV
jgi:hypothetical protein